MLDPTQLLEYIIVPVLRHIEADSPSARVLVWGTVQAESAGGRYIRQMDGNPALGICQMGPDTHRSLWEDFIVYRPRLEARMRGLVPLRDKAEVTPNENHLVYSLAYSVACCRALYLWKPAPLPHPKDITGMAEYWKQYYSTVKGKGTVSHFIERFDAANGPLIFKL